jgi:hypothetical protein
MLDVDLLMAQPCGLTLRRAQSFLRLFSQAIEIHKQSFRGMVKGERTGECF